MRALLTGLVCFVYLMVTCTAESNGEALFINSMYPAKSTAARVRSAPKHSGIPIDRTTFTLKETSFCLYGRDGFNDYGPEDSWL